MCNTNNALILWIKDFSFGSKAFFSVFCHLYTQGLIETLGSMVIFDENQAVSDINKYEFLSTIYVKIVNFLVI